MKVSELQTILNETKELYGDIDVFIEHNGYASESTGFGLKPYNEHSRYNRTYADKPYREVNKDLILIRHKMSED